MAVLNQTDLDVRLQTLNCCIATLSNELLNKIKIGSSDVHCKLLQLQVLQKMLKYIKCYRVEDAEVLATGAIEVDVINIGDTAQFFINGIAITPILTANSTNITTVMTGIKNAINTYSDYTAVFPGVQRAGAVEVTGTCTNETITMEFTGNPDSEILLNGLSGGICSLNCLTEVQVQAMLDYMATTCKSCFQHIGYDYE